MPVILFWNVGRSDIRDPLSWLCRRYSVDVIVLAEFTGSLNALLQALNGETDAPFVQSVTAPNHLQVLTRLGIDKVIPVDDSERISIRHLRPPVGAPLLLVGVHLPSKLHADSAHQGFVIRNLRRQIVEAEGKVGHRNTVVIGDFNVDPFDPAMIAADGMHGVMDKAIARRGERTVFGEPWEFFYNPMWSRLGDESPGPSGTYYRAASDAGAYFWHSFDQVLLRPSLLPCYTSDSLIVPEFADDVVLRVGPGQPTRLSDHLPIVIRLDTERELRS